MMKLCKNCKKEFKSTRKLRHYCSAECAEHFRMTAGNCKTCGCSIKYGRTYCDMCFKKAQTENNTFRKPETIAKIKTTKLERYGTETYNNSEQTKRTCLEKYGATSVFGSEYGKKKIEETSLKRYGVKDSRSAQQTKDKRKATIAKTGISGQFHTLEWNKSMLKKYGTTNPAQNTNIMQKMKTTNLKKYGAEMPLQNNEILAKMKATNLERYGAECSLANDEIRDKATATIKERYGVENVAQSHIIASKKRRKYEYNGMTFDSKPEVEVYKFCKEHNLNCKYQPCKLEFVDGLGKKHSYFPDFEIEGKLYEVKGDHFIKDGKLYFPYRKSVSSKVLAEKDLWNDAKSACMKANNVQIITTSNLQDNLKTIFASNLRK
jgi:uncharacterized Zn finger protein (UPF0148 family)